MGVVLKLRCTRVRAPRSATAGSCLLADFLYRTQPAPAPLAFLLYRHWPHARDRRQHILCFRLVRFPVRGASLGPSAALEQGGKFEYDLVDRVSSTIVSNPCDRHAVLHPPDFCDSPGHVWIVCVEFVGWGIRPYCKPVRMAESCLLGSIGWL
ncbi:hypothetical protein K466DRAFT_607763 [Polyporus arcularius HHB13444]|uniref:Uncharacterized protein n=1 Tax=Polyporus arcularius HHB13444 TaxID=1314778 RepID=A0A5C3NJT1_9APHY|nr:hypothetical protein K466DRAFT_607763 [Polyporus arcularius HHB13444]